MGEPRQARPHPLLGFGDAIGRQQGPSNLEVVVEDTEVVSSHRDQLVRIAGRQGHPDPGLTDHEVG